MSADGLRFTVYRKSVFSGIGKWFGMQDIKVDDSYFDDAFIIKGNDEQRARQFLANPRLRELIEGQPDVRFTVKDDEGWFGADFPDGVDELELVVSGRVKDLWRLEDFYSLFAVALNQLCHIGSAYEDDPGVSL